jgi:hypothetical protein
MPRLPIDYQNCVIYKLVCSDINVTDTYVGHTTHFRERKSKHKSSCNNVNDKSYNLKVYQFIREHGGFENWSMIEMEKISCKDTNEACKRERYWIENLRATLNSNIPTRTDTEKTEYAQEYYQANSSNKIREHNKQTYQVNSNKIKEKSKIYYQANAETLKAVTNCDCGGKYTHKNKSRHFKTDLHIQYCSKIKS